MMTGQDVEQQVNEWADCDVRAGRQTAISQTGGERGRATLWVRGEPVEAGYAQYLRQQARFLTASILYGKDYPISPFRFLDAPLHRFVLQGRRHFMVEEESKEVS